MNRKSVKIDDGGCCGCMAILLLLPLTVTGAILTWKSVVWAWNYAF